MFRFRFLMDMMQKLRQGWLGPHFYYDIIRLARKGWPTLARVGFLVIVLVSLIVMDRTQGQSVSFTRPAEFARRAENFAYLLIVLQYLLVLALLPVYVASSIVEEKENQTLEMLTLTHLTDRELVLGKLGARLMHVGAFALAGFPLLAFMHLWGNVDASMLVYHEIHLFLLLISAGSVCISMSAHSDSGFQAISGSYAWLAGLGFVSVVAAFSLPWMGVWDLVPFNTGPPGRGQAHYWLPLVLLTCGHGALTFIAIRQTIIRMEFLRRDERKKPRKNTGALTLTDSRKVMTTTGKRGQAKSRIHPWAWPVRGHALVWKECIKDGTDYSLSVRWLWIGVLVVAAMCVGFQVWRAVLPIERWERGPRAIAYTFTFTTYFIAGAAYVLVVLFQMTMSVAAEREQGTLTFLLMIPDGRAIILFAKWLGPWWRNWPILAICYLGVLLGFGSSLYDWKGLLFLVLLPWPFLLMMGGLALWLSVLCRRVLYANMAMLGFLGILLLAHLAVGRPILVIGAYYLAVLGAPAELSLLGSDQTSAMLTALSQHAIFLAIAVGCTGHAFWLFGRKDYSAK
ncbi:MAG: ABC transporter permease subunit [Planctomycetes bacterium]|nr:ABC transporter permease subunit [Planctomycetota bacterium]